MDSRVRLRACDEIREQRKEASMCAITHLFPSIAQVEYTLFYHPFYISSYEYQGRTYRFAISAQVGWGFHLLPPSSPLVPPFLFFSFLVVG